MTTIQKTQDFILPALKAPKILAKIQEYRNITTQTDAKGTFKALIKKYPDIGLIQSPPPTKILLQKKQETENPQTIEIIDLCILKNDILEMQKQVLSLPKGKVEFQNILDEKEDRLKYLSNLLYQKIVMNDEELVPLFLEAEVFVLDYDQIEIVLTKLSELLSEVSIDISKSNSQELKTILASIESQNSFLN